MGHWEEIGRAADDVVDGGGDKQPEARAGNEADDERPLEFSWNLRVMVVWLVSCEFRSDHSQSELLNEWNTGSCGKTNTHFLNCFDFMCVRRPCFFCFWFCLCAECVVQAASWLARSVFMQLWMTQNW